MLSKEMPNMYGTEAYQTEIERNFIAIKPVLQWLCISQLLSRLIDHTLSKMTDDITWAVF